MFCRFQTLFTSKQDKTSTKGRNAPINMGSFCNLVSQKKKWLACFFEQALSTKNASLPRKCYLPVKARQGTLSQPQHHNWHLFAPCFCCSLTQPLCLHAQLCMHAVNCTAPSARSQALSLHSLTISLHTGAFWRTWKRRPPIMTLNSIHVLPSLLHAQVSTLCKTIDIFALRRALRLSPFCSESQT